MAKSKPAKSLAILGRTRRTGRWRLAAHSSVLVVFGSSYLDMRNSFVDGDETLHMKVTTVCGSATFLLPDGAEVKPSGMSLLGASTVDVPEHDDDSHLPTLEIEWTSILSRFRIITDRAGQEEEVPESEAPAAEPAAVVVEAPPDEAPPDEAPPVEAAKAEPASAEVAAATAVDPATDSSAAAQPVEAAA